MYQVRLYDRDGRDVVTAAELIALAAVYDGRHALAFSGFGPDRTGATVDAYCRIDDAPVHNREPVDSPDAILVLDATLLEWPALLRGLRPGGLVLINAPGPVEVQPGIHAVTVPATEISLAHTGRELPDAPMLAAFAAASHAVSLVSVRKAITGRFPGALCKADLAGADCAYERLQSTGPIALDATETFAAVLEAHLAQRGPRR